MKMDLTLSAGLAKLASSWQSIAFVLGAAALAWRLVALPTKVDTILNIENEMVQIHQQDLCLRVAEHEHNENKWLDCIALFRTPAK